MKRMFLFLVLIVFVPCCAFAEANFEEAAAIITQGFSESFDYCDVQYNASNETLIVNVAIDGFAKSMYEEIEHGTASSNEYWNQGKGVFLMMYQSIVSVLEMADLGIPENAVYLQLLNDDVAIRNDETTGKSRILWAVNCGMFYIDEMEVY